MDESSLESLIERTYGRILRAAFLMCGSAPDAEDLAQETFLQAARSRTQFAGQSREETWLYGILLNIHRKRLRSRQRRWRRWIAWFDVAQSRRCDEAPDKRLLEDEWRDSLWSAVAGLPEPQQHALLLRYAEGMTCEQIAEAVGCPVGTVKSRLHHGVAALRKSFQDEDHAPARPSANSCAGANSRPNFSGEIP